MSKWREVHAGVFQIGGSGYSNSEDCCVYLLDGGEAWALIDSGVSGFKKIYQNLVQILGDPGKVSYILLTHGHIDHIGGAPYLSSKLPQAKIVAHQLELPAIEQGLPRLTAADWYSVKYGGIPVEVILEEEDTVLEVGQMQVHCLHTPGHTPGGISPYLDWQGKRILFGQDIHGPFQKQWGSNLRQWGKSMECLLSLQADILCEGHAGVIKSAAEVEAFIKRYQKQYLGS